MTKDEALKLAYDETWSAGSEYPIPSFDDVVSFANKLQTIKEALAQPEQEPVATLWQHGETGRTRITMPDDITDCDARWFKAADLYTTPPQRTWVGLTDEEIDKIYEAHHNQYGECESVNFGYERAIEAKIKERA